MARQRGLNATFAAGAIRAVQRESERAREREREREREKGQTQCSESYTTNVHGLGTNPRPRPTNGKPRHVHARRTSTCSGNLHLRVLEPGVEHPGRVPPAGMWLHRCVRSPCPPALLPLFPPPCMKGVRGFHVLTSAPSAVFQPQRRA